MALVSPVADSFILHLGIWESCQDSSTLKSYNRQKGVVFRKWIWWDLQTGFRFYSQKIQVIWSCYSWKTKLEVIIAVSRNKILTIFVSAFFVSNGFSKELIIKSCKANFCSYSFKKCFLKQVIYKRFMKARMSFLMFLMKGSKSFYESL